jgi:hypothetical protein
MNSLPPGSRPGIYPLDEGALGLAAQRGALRRNPSLLELITQGTRQDPPSWLAERLASAPDVRVVWGPVLEFSSGQLLEAWRKNKWVRARLADVLSPRLAALDPWQADQTLRGLVRRGLLAETAGAGKISIGEPGAGAGEGKCIRLTSGERSYLLSLLLVGEGLQAPPPPGLFGKLVKEMEPALRSAAARKASAALACFSVPAGPAAGSEPPEPPPEELLELVRRLIARGEPLDILYQSTRQHRLEARHVTPILLEQRGARFYLIAYCHTRRAKRTFRLDRMRLVD